MLKALAAKNCLIHPSNLRTFSLTGGKGIAEGNGGEGFRFRQPHWAFSCLNGEINGSDKVDAVDDGNSVERRFKSINALSDNRHPRVGMSLQKYINCLVDAFPAVIRTGRTPMICNLVFVTPLIPWVVGITCSGRHPKEYNNSMPLEHV